ncbi:MAG: HU family DNA-binding protein [Treponematales bacterium]
MAVKLKKIARRNPLLPAAQSKWYLVQETAGSVGIAEIAREIEGRSALSHGDVLSVLDNLVEVMPVFLKLGQTVKLEGFGSFRLSVTSEGKAAAADLSARDVSGAKLVFRPSADLKRNLDGLEYEVAEAAQSAPGTK